MGANKVVVLDAINTPFAVSTESGELLFDIINNNFKSNLPIVLDFTGIELIVSTFLNASIGQLYGLYSTDKIQNLLSVLNMGNDDLTILKKVTDRAKEYFKDKEGFESVFKKNLPDA
ncbi:MAG: STAS-like domain-containing protein [Agriterribacter sp.]